MPPSATDAHTANVTLGRAHERWRARAFGLDLEGHFPVPGLDHDESVGGARLTVLEAVDAGELDGPWSRAESDRLREWRKPDGRIEAALDRHDRLGYRLFADGYGRYVVTHDGGLIRCAPPRTAAWRWQRCLIGQIFPLAAVLRGLEVFHASAVRVGNVAVAFVGASQAGKSSVAVNLMLRGARLVTDDVVTLEASGGGLVAHPGAGVTSVRHAAVEAIAPEHRSRLGRVLGDDGEALRVMVERERRVLPLAAMYFLERDDPAAGEADAAPPFERISPPDPRLLLASTFNFSVRTPERLRNQLDVCARLSETVPIFRVKIVPTLSAAALAAQVEAHARDLDAGAGGRR
jgi:hypothetical protein